MKKNIEIERMMSISNEFYKLTKISEKSVLQITGTELIPIIVNCAFSIELSLKSIYYINNEKKATGHNITDLYNLTKEYGLESFLLHDFSKEEIKRILNQLENAYTEYRYIYEQKKTLTISPSLLKDFIAFVNLYCNEYLEKRLN